MEKQQRGKNKRIKARKKHLERVLLLPGRAPPKRVKARQRRRRIMYNVIHYGWDKSKYLRAGNFRQKLADELLTDNGRAILDVENGLFSNYSNAWRKERNKANRATVQGKAWQADCPPKADLGFLEDDTSISERVCTWEAVFKNPQKCSSCGKDKRSRWGCPNHPESGAFCSSRCFMVGHRHHILYSFRSDESSSSTSASSSKEKKRKEKEKKKINKKK